MKECRSCKEQKPRAEFPRDSTRKDGHHPYCRPCRAKIEKDRQQKRKERGARRLSDLARYKRLTEYGPAPPFARPFRWKRQKGHCFYCQAKLVSPEFGELDHWTPLARGGRGILCNLVLACKSCNHSKGAKTGDEFIVWLSEVKGVK